MDHNKKYNNNKMQLNLSAFSTSLSEEIAHPTVYSALNNHFDNKTGLWWTPKMTIMVLLP